MSLLIGDNLVVSIHYTLTDEKGEVIDSSQGREPLTYLHGAGNIIPGLEKALVGKTTGDSLEVQVQPEEAYGLPDPQMIQKLPHDMFANIDNLEAGMQLNAQGQNGQMLQLTVTEVADDGVTVDANHPLAGQVLNFAVSVEGIREASAEEIEHGHVH